MQITFSAAPHSVAIRSSRSMPRRLRAVAAIFAALAVLGVSWGTLAAPGFVSATSGVVTVLGI